MTRHVFVAAIAASAAVGGTSVASAQGSGCEDAAVRISSNALPRVGAKEWNDWVTLTGCGTRGATVIAGALQSDGIRTETELTRLDHLAGILDGWFQPQLIAAYEGLIRSPDASNAIRLRSMWLLSGLYAPETEVAGPLQGYMAASCETYGRSTTLRDAPQSLPAAAYDQANDAIAIAAADRNAPEYVRTTANCWAGVIRDELNNGTEEAQGAGGGGSVGNSGSVGIGGGVSTGSGGTGSDVVVQQPATVVVQPPVRVVYECGSQFVFYNDADYDLAVRYSGYGAGGVLRVVHGGPYIWTAPRFAPVRFWLDDREVWYSDAVYRPCGGDVIFAPSVRIWTGWHVGLGVFFNAGYYSPRYIRPRVLIPVVGRRPIIIDRGRNDRNERSDRDGGAEPRRDPRDGPSRGAPRTAVPRNETPQGEAGRRSQSAPNYGQRIYTVPSRPSQGNPRYSVERPSTPQREPQREPQRAAPQRTAPAPTQRSAQPSKGGGGQGGGDRRGGGGGERQSGGHASASHGKPGR